ncbi:hypothetical protein ABZ820_41760 [Streptomyces diacarni]|uniref:hypothetical protein n=1 Tax=Streptomyces diacarni TaxID=2800381 RepID=UPI00340C89C6
MARSDEIPVPQPTGEPRSFSLPGTLAQRWNALAVAACGATVLVMGYRHRWTNDDALIYTRAVRQILAGNGPVFNVAERAETSTGTLWQWLLAAGSAVPGVDDPLRLAVALGLLLTVVGYLLALDGTRRMIRLSRPAGALLPVGVVLLLPLAATWDYATSGLETGLSFAYLGGCWWLLVHARVLRARAGGGGPALPATAFALGLGPLVRPDLALVSGLFLVALWLMWRPGWRTTLGWAGAAAALPVAYEVFRAGYYGVLVPLPAIAKEASGTEWRFGWDYLLNTLNTYALWVPLGLVTAYALHAAARRALGRPPEDAHAPDGAQAPDGPHEPDDSHEPEGTRRPGAVHVADAALVGAPVVAGLLSAFFVVKIGGDFMHGRMVLPALFLVLLPVFLLPYGRMTAALAGAVGVWGLVCALALRPPIESPDDPRIVFDSHTVYQHILGDRHPVGQLAHTTTPRAFTTAARHTIESGKHGLVLRLPYDKGYPVVPLAPHVRAPVAAAEARLGHAGAVLPLDGFVIDILGLANPLGAHTEPVSHKKAGHEKPIDRAWIVADVTAPGTSVPGVDSGDVRAARHALTCGPLPELLASTREAMSPARFWGNLTGAWDRTRMRIPADPVEAERTLCRRP